MKHLLIAAVVAAATITTPAFATDTAVSVSIGQPGFYGRLDIGGYPQPQVIYRQPRVIEYVEVERQPIYLRVPPGHRKHWDKHCHEYDACGERVYFVRSDWYNRDYVPRYQEQHREYQDGGRNDHGDDHQGNSGHGKNKGKGH
jgi:hypothetical protein